MRPLPRCRPLANTAGLLLFVVIAPLPPAGAAEPPAGFALLERSAARLTGLVMTGRQTATIWYESGADVSVTREYRSHGKSRSETLLPRSHRGRISVDDGRERWYYDPDTRALVHGLTAAGADDRYDFPLVKQNYRAVVAPVPEVIAGRPAWVVTVQAREPGKPLRRLWLDTRTAFPLKVEKFHADGERQSVAEYQEISFPASLSSARFARPVPGMIESERTMGASRPVSLAELRSALGAAPATSLPLGYRFRDAAVVGDGREALYHVRYDDGLSVVSLFISRSGSRLPGGGPGRITLSRGEATLQDDPHLRLLTWRAGSLYCALVGDLAASALAGLVDASDMATGAAPQPGRPAGIDLWIVLPGLVLVAAIALWCALFFLRRRGAQACG
jgi:outer membrane lipoprotein-sorting protein